MGFARWGQLARHYGEPVIRGPVRCSLPHG